LRFLVVDQVLLMSLLRMNLACLTDPS
jgi:hypothetical protein